MATDVDMRYANEFLNSSGFNSYSDNAGIQGYSDLEMTWSILRDWHQSDWHGEIPHLLDGTIDAL